MNMKKEHLLAIAQVREFFEPVVTRNGEPWDYDRLLAEFHGRDV